MSKMKKLVVLLLILAVAVLLPLSVSAEEVADGWKGDSFYRDGEVIKGQVFYDYVDTGKYYYADSNGNIVKNQWVQPYLFDLDLNDANRTAWYRFGNDGAAITGELDGYYHNDDGRMLTGGRYKKDNDWYIAGKDGKATKLANNAWSLVEGKWYFVADGQLCFGGIYEISDIDFYFDGTGALADEAGFEWVYIEENDNYADVFVKADGTVQYEGWVEFDGDFYYLLDGYMATGVLELPHATFLLDESGKLVVDREYTFESYFYDEEEDYGYWTYTTYRTNANGEILMNAWYYNTEAKAWQYFDENGVAIQDGERELHGATYVFENGYAVTNYLYSKYDVEAQKDVWYWIGTDCKAVKAADGWYAIGDIKDNNWRYILNGDVARDGINNIGGTNYFFTENGWLADESVVYIYDTPGYEDGYYATDVNGCVNTTFGWRVINGQYVFVKDNGKVHINGWIYVNNNWYYMDWAYMAHGTTIQIYGRTYYFDANGTTSDVTVDGWYMTSAYGVKFFNYAINVDDGWQYIDGAWYYFQGGYAVTNTIREIDEERYAFDSMGRMLVCGWYEFNGSTYYIEPTGKLVKDAIKAVDGSYYIFNEYGALVIRDYAFITGFDANENGEDELYFVDAEGRIAQVEGNEGWYQFFNEWYYIEDAYVFNSGRRWVEKSQNYYSFNYDGTMVADAIYMNMYHDVNGTVVNGWINYNGEWIYADKDNKLVSNCTYLIDGKYYTFEGYTLKMGTFDYVRNGNIFESVTTDIAGAIIDVVDFNDGYYYDVNNGYGRVYYMENGEAYNGWLGNYYFENGRLYTNSTVWDYDLEAYYYVDYHGNCVYNQWISKTNVYNNTYWYLAKADGTLYANEWYTDGTNWYYFGGNYYEDCIMLADGVYYIDGVAHKFDANGVWVGEYVETTYADGWNLIDGNWYYVYAGYTYDLGIYSIGGAWYAFDGEGMVTNKWFEGRYFGADGKMVEYAAGWNVINGKWVFFNQKHQVMSGWVYEGTTAYYIKAIYDENVYTEAYEDVIGYEMVTGFYGVDGDLYYFGDNGACQGAVVEDGWYSYGADWFFVDGGFAADGEYEIDGVTYVFENGKMVTNDISSSRYLDANGNVVATGWYVVDGQWIYVTADGYVARGLHSIGNAEYYFDGYGYWVA